ncbi:MAG: DUF4395 domain-containing protein [Halobacteria archaeon]|nr:DUF4395 domain-containing protein [Halobacteria archaeon]
MTTPVKIDPRAPRLGQAITATILIVAIALQLPVLVYAVTVILVLAVISGWRLDLYAVLWKNGVSRYVSEPDHREGASPHRFAKLMGATFTTVASTLIIAGFPLVGYAFAAFVALLAALAATTGLCIGCRMYRQVSFFRRIGIV